MATTNGAAAGSSPRYLTLDAWRGLACLLVVVHHAGFAVLFEKKDAFRRSVALVLDRCDLGVPIFFVISGYCITASLDAIRRKGHGPARFLRRRVRRIYPPYWAAVGFFLAVTLGLQRVGLERLLWGTHRALELVRPQKLTIPQWIGNLTLTETWRHLIGGGPQEIFTRVAWTLCYEEQFYFVCFAVLLLAGRRLFGTLAVVTGVTVFLRMALADAGMIHRFRGTFIDLWHEFAIGIGVYWVLNRASRRWDRPALLAAFGVMAALGLMVPKPANDPVEYGVFTASVLGVLLVLLHRFDEVAGRSRWIVPLRACGIRCYSMYLVHLPVCTVGLLTLQELGVESYAARLFIAIPTVTMASVAAAWAFFALVERRFLNAPVVGARPERRLVPVAGEAPGGASP